MDMWCEHCQDHYDDDHYDTPSGNHKRTADAGPTGYHAALYDLVHKLINDPTPPNTPISIHIMVLAYFIQKWSRMPVSQRRD